MRAYSSGLLGFLFARPDGVGDAWPGLRRGSEVNGGQTLVVE